MDPQQTTSHKAQVQTWLLGDCGDPEFWPNLLGPVRVYAVRPSRVCQIKAALEGPRELFSPRGMLEPPVTGIAVGQGAEREAAAFACAA